LFPNLELSLCTYPCPGLLHLAPETGSVLLFFGFRENEVSVPVFCLIYFISLSFRENEVGGRGCESAGVRVWVCEGVWEYEDV